MKCNVSESPQLAAFDAKQSNQISKDSESAEAGLSCQTLIIQMLLQTECNEGIEH